MNKVGREKVYLMPIGDEDDFVNWEDFIICKGKKLT